MNEFTGKWRITHMDLWAQEMVDLIESGHFEFYENNQGHFVFCAVKGWLDVRVNTRMPELEFSWEGESEGDKLCGRGKIEFPTPFEGEGIIYIHNGDESAFTIKLEEGLAASNVVKFK